MKKALDGFIKRGHCEHMKIKFFHSLAAQSITFNATVTAEDENTFTVRIPDRVRSIKFPPFNGKAVVRVLKSKISPASISK